MATGERGTALPLVLLALAALLTCSVVVAAVAGAARDRARAQTAADAAALAGAVEGRSAAGELAVANGAELVHYGVEGEVTVVRVWVGRAVAEARASVELAGARPPCPPARRLPVREC
jgi:Flp pilus assembly protein TadG